MSGGSASSFEAWESGPVYVDVWLNYAKWNHPAWPDGDPVLVGDTLYEEDDDTGSVWVVCDIRLEQRGICEAPTIRIGNPLTGLEGDDPVLVAVSAVGSEGPDVVVMDGYRRGPRFSDWMNGVES